MADLKSSWVESLVDGNLRDSMYIILCTLIVLLLPSTSFSPEKDKRARVRVGNQTRDRYAHVHYL